MVRRTAYGSLHAWVLLLAFGATALLAQLAPTGTVLRWPIYGLPLVSIAVWLAFASGSGGNLYYDRRQLFALLIFVLAAFVSVTYSTSVHFESIRDVLIVIGIFLTFLPVFRVDDRTIKALFSVLAVSLMIEAVIAQEGTLFSFDLLASRGIAESILAFPLSVIALYFVIRKDGPWALMAIILSLVAFKRIAMLAIATAITFYFLISFMQKLTDSRNFKKYSSYVTIFVVGLLALVALNLNIIVEFIIDIFEIGTSPNGFTLGRYYLNSVVDHQLRSQGLGSWLFGNGPGSGDRLVSSLGLRLVNMHNDFVKLLFDYGILGMILILGAHFMIYRGGKATLAIFVLNGVLMITDNTVIYYFHYFVTFMVVRALHQEYALRAVASKAPVHTVRLPVGVRSGT